MKNPPVLFRRSRRVAAGLGALALVAVGPRSQAAPAPGMPRNLVSPPETITEHSVTLVWDKPEAYAGVGKYLVFCDGRLAGATAKTNFTVGQLPPGQSHAFSIAAQEATGNRRSALSDSVAIKTHAAGARLNILAYGAKGDGRTKNTVAIQNAIDACPSGGTVEVPSGVFLTGALFLKSNLTLYIAAGGVLQGTTDVHDYEPMIRNRFEGWEMDTFASLINAGHLDHAGPANVRNIAIRGEGRIAGGGKTLAQAMIAAKGLRSRGRLFCIMNCDGLDIAGLTVEQSSSWTIHYIYSENVSCRDLTIRSTVQNGDGIDPDSSRNSFIFNCSFSTDDDCIAIKSGKNPEGGIIGRPTENVSITNCDFIAGHGISIGSETSGGVRNVLVRDCATGNLINGLQIKATKDRGAVVENVLVQDCDLRKIRILTKLGYNNDGAPAPEAPSFRDFTFSHLDLRKAGTAEPVIIVHGFDDGAHRTENVRFEDLQLPNQGVVEVDQSRRVKFVRVVTENGAKPIYRVTNSAAVEY